MTVIETETAQPGEYPQSFDGSRCIHSRHCVLDRPDVFVPNVRGEWIHPDHATPDEVVELAHNCPSGAISCDGTHARVGFKAPT